MTPAVESWSLPLALLVTTVAAVTDFRHGRIPNWLTLPALASGPLLALAVGGGGAALEALAGALLCGGAPALVYALSRGVAIGGGDIKLFAALGALLGPVLGVQTQLVAYGVVLAAGLLMLAWRGRLLAALGNSLLLVIQPLRRPERRRPITPELLTALRMGPAIWLATLATTAVEASWWSLWAA